MNISSDAQKIIDAAGAGAMDYINSKGFQGSRLTSGEATNALQGFTAQGNPYSSSNMQSAATNPTGMPNLADPYGLQNSIYANNGVDAAQQAYLAEVDKLRKFDTGTVGQQVTIGEELNPMSVIRGEQATALGQRSLARTGFADTANAVRDLYLAKKDVADRQFSTAKEQRDQLTNLIVQNPGAGITYADTIDSAASKMNNFRLSEETKVKKEAETAKKDSEKSAFKEALRALGLKTSGNYKELEKRLTKANKEAVSLAKSRSDQEYNMKIAQFNKSMSGGSKVSELQAVDTAFSQTGGDWGKTVQMLQGKYDVSAGSTIDNELRRRNGLPPVNTKQSTPNLIELSDGTLLDKNTGDIFENN